MSQSPARIPPATGIVTWGAAETARQIACGQVSAREVFAAYISRIEVTQSLVNAYAVLLLEGAEQAAAIADELQAAGNTLGPLHGVPLSIKECFWVAGTPSCLGLAHLRHELDPHDGPLVARLKQAGGIVLGKTNVPQLMLWNECDNPIYGRTNNPWNLECTPGGSSGGEAASISSGTSALGLGNDLGGSLRVPAHLCGIASLKPTSYRLTRKGARRNFCGLDAVVTQPGPLARKVEDLELALQVLRGQPADQADDFDIQPVNLGKSSSISLAGMKVLAWCDDGIFPASPAIQRAVKESAATLRELGMIVDLVTPDSADTFSKELKAELAEAFEVFLGLLASDGGADMRRLAASSPLDWRPTRLFWLAGLGWVSRGVLAPLLKLIGENWSSYLLQKTKRCSSAAYWQLVQRRDGVQSKFFSRLKKDNYQAILSPPYGLPATPHGAAINLLPASSYATWANLFGLPAGVVPWSNVSPGETAGRVVSRDRVLTQARGVDQQSEGLPVGVQVAALPWREDVCLRVMAELEANRPKESLLGQ